MYQLINDIISKIKKDNPLILNVTNYVTIDFVANGLLSLGASPIMSFSEAEIAELVALSHAIVINLGTLNHPFNHLCNQIGDICQSVNKPIILDPVGAGASTYRTETSAAILKNAPVTVIRGNASEIITLAGKHVQTKGVDSSATSYDSIQFAEILALKQNITVCMSGKIDVIIGQSNKTTFDRGSAFMPKITGTGCLLSAVVAAFNAVHDNPYEATSAATLFYSVCGEIAEKKSQGPASFKTAFLDALHQSPQRENYESQ